MCASEMCSYASLPAAASESGAAASSKIAGCPAARTARATRCPSQPLPKTATGLFLDASGNCPICSASRWALLIPCWTALTISVGNCAAPATWMPGGICASPETKPHATNYKAGDVIDGAALVISEAFSVSSNVSVGYDGDVNPAAGTAVDEGFIANSNANTTQTKVNTGSALDDGGDANNTRIVAAADGNVFIKSASALDVSTSGRMKVLLSIKRVNA